MKTISTIYHLSSAQDIDSEFLESIKAIFKSKPITIIVEEGENDYDFTSESINILEERLQEDQSDYISGKDSIDQLRVKYGL
jgi:hypothetical protein